jgi:hypothetical protein
VLCIEVSAECGLEDVEKLLGFLARERKGVMNGWEDALQGAERLRFEHDGRSSWLYGAARRQADGSCTPMADRLKVGTKVKVTSHSGKVVLGGQS